MTFCPLTTTTRTLPTGRNASEESTLQRSTPTLRDWLLRLLGGKKGKAKRSERKRSRATRSCLIGCKKSTRSICHEQRAKRRRPARPRSGAMMRDALLRSRAAPRPEVQSWATATFPGLLREAQCRRCWTWCCTVRTARTCRRSVNC